MLMSDIGIAVITHNRPEAFSVCLNSIQATNPDAELIAVLDGSDAGYDFGSLDSYSHIEPGGNIAHAKNTALEILMDFGCEHLFLVEDDMEVLNPIIWEGYITAGRRAGHEHLSLGHGRLNLKPKSVAAYTQYWRNYSAGLSYYTANSIKVGGLFEERMVNAFEHVEHTLRLAKFGFCPPYGWGMADARYSRDWIIDTGLPSAGGANSFPDEARGVWSEIAPDTYEQIFGKVPQC